jgi:hypothetical protein
VRIEGRGLPDLALTAGAYEIVVTPNREHVAVRALEEAGRMPSARSLRFDLAAGAEVGVLVRHGASGPRLELREPPFDRTDEDERPAGPAATLVEGLWMDRIAVPVPACATCHGR